MPLEGRRKSPRTAGLGGSELMARRTEDPRVERSLHWSARRNDLARSFRKQSPSIMKRPNLRERSRSTSCASSPPGPGAERVATVGSAGGGRGRQRQAGSVGPVPEGWRAAFRAPRSAPSGACAGRLRLRAEAPSTTRRSSRLNEDRSSSSAGLSFRNALFFHRGIFSPAGRAPRGRQRSYVEARMVRRNGVGKDALCCLFHSHARSATRRAGTLEARAEHTQPGPYWLSNVDPARPSKRQAIVLFVCASQLDAPD